MRKFHPDFDRLLADILRGDPEGQLVVQRGESDHVTHCLQQRVRRTMPDVADRVVWLPRLSNAEYLNLLSAGDALLDPIHYGSGNTAYDALAVGKPIVTLPGPFQRGRYTLACYCKMGVIDCVAESAADYVAMAVRLGRDEDFRMAVTRRIREASQDLFEDGNAVQEHARFLDRMVEESRRR